MCLRRYLKINNEAILYKKKGGEKCVGHEVVAYGAGRRKDSVN